MWRRCLHCQLRKVPISSCPDVKAYFRTCHVPGLGLAQRLIFQFLGTHPSCSVGVAWYHLSSPSFTSKYETPFGSFHLFSDPAGSVAFAKLNVFGPLQNSTWQQQPQQRQQERFPVSTVTFSVPVPVTVAMLFSQKHGSPYKFHLPSNALVLTTTAILSCVRSRVQRGHRGGQKQRSAAQPKIPSEARCRERPGLTSRLG